MVYAKIDFNKFWNLIQEEIPKHEHDLRVSALIFESLLSYIIDEMVKIFLKEEKDLTNYQQLNLLRENNLIEHTHHQEIQLLRNIRNLIAHNPYLYDQDVQNEFETLLLTMPDRRVDPDTDLDYHKKLEETMELGPKAVENIVRWEYFAGSLIISMIAKYDNCFDKHNH